MPSTRGPLPKRSTERRRKNKVPGETVISREEPVIVPRLPGAKSAEGAEIHPVARRWYNSLAQSGQSDYFEPSDWLAARYVVEAMSKNLNSPRFSAQLFGVVWNAMDDLLTTEAARRRSRIEVERGIVEEATGPTAIDKYRERLAK